MLVETCLRFFNDSVDQRGWKGQNENRWTLVTEFTGVRDKMFRCYCSSCGRDGTTTNKLQFVRVHYKLFSLKVDYYIVLFLQLSYFKLPKQRVRIECQTSSFSEIDSCIFLMAAGLEYNEGTERETKTSLLSSGSKFDSSFGFKRHPARKEAVPQARSSSLGPRRQMLDITCPS